jgi:hypothetical protein
MHISFSERAISFQKVPLLHRVCLYGCKALGQRKEGPVLSPLGGPYFSNALVFRLYPTQKYLVSWIMAPDE